MTLRAIIPVDRFEPYTVGLLQDRDITVIRVKDTYHLYFPKGSELDTSEPNYDKVTVPFINKTGTREFLHLAKGQVEEKNS